MAKVTEIAPDLFRVSVFVPDLNMQFNHFVVRDDEPLLFHTGYRHTFPEVREGVAQVLDPSRLRWISFSARRIGSQTLAATASAPESSLKG